MFCRKCGEELANEAVVCVHCGVPTSNANSGQSRIAFILLGVFLGQFGIHNFYAGYNGKAIAQLLITIFLGWLILPYIAVFIWMIIEVATIDVDASGKKFV